MIASLTPQEIVDRLNDFVIGQLEAKRAVAIALRNRARRMALVDDPIQEEIHPKNIIMKGPTGVGKTEIARRLARIVNAPFIKVEATKYTEVGYVGRDVESMVRDLLNNALKMVREEHEITVKDKAQQMTEDKILEILVSGSENKIDTTTSTPDEEEEAVKNIFRKKLQSGQLEDKEIEIKAKTTNAPVMQVMAMPGMEEIENQMQNLLGDMLPKKKSRKKFAIKEARKIILEEMIEQLLDFDKIKEEAIRRTENNGIIFIDEIDKIASRATKGGGEVSREGVQRDILPIVEGSTVNTKHGAVNTDHILFIAAGAFHIASVSDLIPELQGRFPIRVELTPLNEEDYISILHNPKNALTKQYQALLSTENVVITFEAEGVRRIAQIAVELNNKFENIGARRLHALLEKILEEVSFQAEKYQGQEIIINAKYVNDQLSSIIKDQDLSRYIL